jgi:ribose-phosphate pyrophosphokinase
MLIIGCSQGILGRRIANHLRVPFRKLDVGFFPDSELRVQFPCDVKGEDVVLVQSLHPPNTALFELVIALTTAREMGAHSVTLVIPYMAYLRQDKRFHPNECKSNSIAALLISSADRIITIDPHLHRVKALGKIFKAKVKTLSANVLLAAFIAKHYKNELIIGPDAESYQWAARIARRVRAHAIVLKKKRYGSRKVSIRIRGAGIEGAGLRNKTAVIVDDIISSGHTMMETVKEAKRLGAKRVVCLCVHGLFAENALAKLRKLGAVVHATNTVQNPVDDIDVSGILAKAL